MPQINRHSTVRQSYSKHNTKGTNKSNKTHQNKGKTTGGRGH